MLPFARAPAEVRNPRDLRYATNKLPDCFHTATTARKQHGCDELCSRAKLERMLLVLDRMCSLATSAKSTAHNTSVREL